MKIRNLNNDKSQPVKKTAYIQTARGVKTDNLPVLAKTSVFVVNWLRGPVVQRPSDLYRFPHSTIEQQKEHWGTKIL